MGVNFNNIILAHHNWKNKLKAAIENQQQIDTGVAGRDDQCELGKWIYGEGKKFASLNEYNDLKTKHAKFHACIPAIIDQSRSSKSKALEMLESQKGGVFGMASSQCINAIIALRDVVSKT